MGTAVAVEDAHLVGQARLGDGDARDRAGGVERRLVEPAVVAGGDGGVDAALRLREAVVEVVRKASVKTSVPVTKPTPSTMARTVAVSRPR